MVLAFRAGASSEAAGEEGYSELLGTLLCRGAGRWDRRAFALECDRHGANLDVFASRDLFVLELSVLPDDLDWGVGLLAAMLFEPRFDSAEVATAAREQLEQLLARSDEQRSAHADLARGMLFGVHSPYGRPVSGSVEALQGATPSGLSDFHQRVLLGSTPAALCVTGRFVDSELERLVEQTFSASAQGREPHRIPRPSTGILLADPERFQNLDFPTDQSRVLIGMPAVGRGDPKYLESQMANELFGGAFLSRLTRAVRAREGLAYSAGSRLWAGFLGGCLWISLQTDHSNLEKALRTVRVSMDQIIKDGLPESEVEQFRSFALASLTFEYDSLSGLASRLLDHVLFQEPWLPDLRREAILQRIDSATLETTLNRLLKPEQAVVCLSGRTPPQGIEAGFFDSPSRTHFRQYRVSPLELSPTPDFPKEEDSSAKLVAHHERGELRVLPNGVHLLSLPRPELLSISVQVWTLTGSMDEPEGASGMSHFLEHLMFRGTERFPDGEFDAILAQKGGMNNAFTSEDFTVYTDYVVAAGLADALCLESDRFANLSIDEDLFLTEREVVLEERSLRVDSSPLGKVYEQLQKAAFPNHPYGHPVIGWKDDLLNLTSEDLRKHFDRAVDPSKLLVVIAGGCDPSRAADWVGRTFGRELSSRGIHSKQTAWPVQSDEEPVSPLRAQTLVFQERSGYSYFLASFRFPRVGHRDYEAAELLSRMIGHGDSSRLHDHFVRDTGLALEVWVSYESPTRDHPLLHLGMATTDAFETADRKQSLVEFLNGLSESFDESELEKAKVGWCAEEAFGTDELEDWALEIAGRVMVLPWSEVWTGSDRIGAVTLEEIKSAASRYLNPENGVYAHLQGHTAEEDESESES